MTTIGLLGAAQATPPNKFSEDTLARVSLPAGGHFTTTRARVEIDRLTVAPGGDSGWHSHEGPLLLVIKQGTLTNYIVRNGRCVRTRVSAGQSFLESRDVAHLARNEGTRTLVVYAINNYPKGGPTAVDAKDLYACDN